MSGSRLLRYSVVSAACVQQLQQLRVLATINGRTSSGFQRLLGKASWFCTELSRVLVNLGAERVSRALLASWLVRPLLRAVGSRSSRRSPLCTSSEPAREDMHARGCWLSQGDWQAVLGLVALGDMLCCCTLSCQRCLLTHLGGRLDIGHCCPSPHLMHGRTLCWT